MSKHPIPKSWIVLNARACDPDDVKYSAETCTILEELGIAEGRVAELEAENARLKASVSDVVHAISKLIRSYAVEGGEPDRKEYPADTCEELLARISALLASRATVKDQKNSEITCDLCVHEGEMCPSLGLQMMNERCDKYTRTTAKEGGNRGRE